MFLVPLLGEPVPSSPTLAFAMQTLCSAENNTLNNKYIPAILIYHVVIAGIISIFAENPLHGKETDN